MRQDEIWDLLEDLELPPLDRQQLNEEIVQNNITLQILELEASWIPNDAPLDTLGGDEYDREGWIANEDFDLANEI